MSEWGIARIPDLDQLRRIDEIERRLGALEAGADTSPVWALAAAAFGTPRAGETFTASSARALLAMREATGGGG
jgi:hypothetical protein